jgi:hypothetical protein
MKSKHLQFFSKNLRKYRRLKTRISEKFSPRLLRKLDLL